MKKFRVEGGSDRSHFFSSLSQTVSGGNQEEIGHSHFLGMRKKRRCGKVLFESTIGNPFLQVSKSYFRIPRPHEKNYMNHWVFLQKRAFEMLSLWRMMNQGFSTRVIDFGKFFFQKKISSLKRQ